MSSIEISLIVIFIIFGVYFYFFLTAVNKKFGFFIWCMSAGFLSFIFASFLYSLGIIQIISGKLIASNIHATGILFCVIAWIFFHTGAYFGTYLIQKRHELSLWTVRSYQLEKQNLEKREKVIKKLFPELEGKLLGIRIQNEIRRQRWIY